MYIFSTEWLKFRFNDDKFEELTAIELDLKLEMFWTEVRNKEGNQYSVSMMRVLRSGIARYLTRPPHKKPFCLLSGEEFLKSNTMFFAMLKNMKKNGKDLSKHYPPITQNDLKKIQTTIVVQYK